MTRLGVGLQSTEDFVSRDVREVQVEQDQCGPVFPGQIQAQAALHGGKEPHFGSMGEETLDELEIRKVVFDVEDDLGFLGRVQVDLVGEGRACPRDPVHRAVRLRQFDPEGAPPAHGALDPQRAPHRLAQALGERQAEPGSLDPRLLDPQTLEGSEDQLQLFRCDAGAGIVHVDPHPTLGGFLDGEIHQASLPIVLDRVGKEIQEHLLETLTVAHHEAGGETGRPTREADVFSGGQGGDQVEALPDHLGDRHRLDGDGQPALLDSCDVQHFVDEVEQVPPPLEDMLDALALLGAQGVHLEQLGKPKDGVQRSPQLMAHPGEKLALGLVGPVGLVLRLADLLPRLGATADVVDERAEHVPGPQPNGRDRQFDRELVSVSVQCRDLDPRVQDRPGAGLEKVRQAPPVGVPVLRGDDRVGHGPADGFFLGPAKGRLGLGVPPGDDAAGIHADEGVERAVDDQADALLAVPQRPLGLPALGDVPGDRKIQLLLD